MERETGHILKGEIVRCGLEFLEEDREYDQTTHK
jgi:hypothetical protein